MIAKKVIALATTESTVSISGASKKNGSLRFQVEHQKLSVVTISDPYPLPGTYERIDSLGGVMVI